MKNTRDRWPTLRPEIEAIEIGAQHSEILSTLQRQIHPSRVEYLWVACVRSNILEDVVYIQIVAVSLITVELPIANFLMQCDGCGTHPGVGS
jgi:hypothetical protein